MFSVHLLTQFFKTDFLKKSRELLYGEVRFKITGSNTASGRTSSVSCVRGSIQNMEVKEGTINQQNKKVENMVIKCTKSKMSSKLF